MPIGFSVNKNLCIVISRDILNELIWCVKYSDDFLVNRMEAYYKRGLSSKVSHRIGGLYREFRIWGFSPIEMKYAIAGQYVISNDDTKVGSWLTGVEAGTVMMKSDTVVANIDKGKRKNNRKNKYRKNKGGSKDVN